jgi:hypothetical protein
MTTFATTLNNHSLAAVTTLAAVYPVVMNDKLSLCDLAVSGVFAGLTACFELPGAALLAAMAAGVLWLTPRRALLAFVPAALLPVAAQAALNHAAVGDWRPVYEKIDGPWYRYEGSHWNRVGADRRGIDFAGDSEKRPIYAFHLLLGHHGVFSLTPIWLLSALGLAQSLSRSAHRESRWDEN